MDITNGSTASPFLYLDEGGFGNGDIDWGGSPMTNTLLAGATYFLKVEMIGGDIRPTNDLKVTTP